MWWKVFLFVFFPLLSLASEKGPLFPCLEEFCRAENSIALADKDSSCPSVVEAYTQPRERDEGSFRHMEQNFLILLSDLQLGRQNPRALAEMSVPSVEVYLLLMMAHFHWDSCACIIPKMIQNKKKGKRDRRKIHYHYQREQPILHLDGSSIHMLQNIEFLFC